MPLPRILEPLKIRDFALLWSGMTVSVLGDRFFYLAPPVSQQRRSAREQR